MCLIVDADVAAEFLAQPGAVLNWLTGTTGNPRLVAAGTLKDELLKVAAVQSLLVQLDRAGRLRSADLALLQKPEKHLKRQRACRANDIHVVALAIVSGARTLATLDKALMHDFKNPSLISNPRGSVYTDSNKHSHLLRHTPKSCGVRGPEKSLSG